MGAQRATKLGMELHQIRYVVALVQARNFTLAAERCHVTQPALTQAIKKLEEEVGSPLFVRGRAGVELTDLGRLLWPRFRAIAAKVSDVAAAVDDFHQLKQVPARIGALPTLGSQRILDHLAAFQREAPGSEVELHTAGGEALLRRLEEGELDIVFTSGDEAPPGWAIRQVVYTEVYKVVLPKDHPLAGREAIDLNTLSQEPYIDRLACEMRELAQARCAAAGVQLYATYRTDRECLVEAMVRRGLGLALMPESAIEHIGTVSRPLVGLTLERTVVVMRCADQAATPVAKKLWKTIRGPN